ncbi:mce related family protein [Asticcacaulis biprosthecium C19]|uniref:Mce related family protein n=1 Tax=Asticcacaulis biprosthecium C19 TaxID=715226 RepID=F4QSI6_9CAUL|nr:MlaD family protein [Asticcacaulis biprosthecium]EGF89706.1 mce related family protein [Asticcacaulis biprosthecium C19]
MERQAHYAFVGLVTFVMALILLAFTFWFIKFDFNQEFGVYDVEFNQPVDFLNKGAEVHFNGIKVGEVTSLRLGKANTAQVFARIKLDSETPIRVDSVATLQPQGITGLLYMQISPGSASSPLLKRKPGGPPPVIRSEESALAKLLQGSGSVVEKTYESLDRVNRLLSDRNIKTFSDTLDNLQSITADIENRQQMLDDAHEAVISAGQAADAITKLANSTDGVMAQQLPETLEKINAATDKLATAAERVSVVADSVKGPADQINTQTLPQMQESLENLNEASESLKDLVEQVQQNPQGLVTKPVAKQRKVSE